MAAMRQDDTKANITLLTRTIWAALVFDLPLAGLFHLVALGRPFDAVVVAEVVVVAVAVSFAVGLVVLLLVAHQVAEREAVVAGDQVDAAKRRAAIRTTT